VTQPLPPKTSLLGIGGAASGGPAALALAGAPWGVVAVLAVIVVLVVGGIAIAQAVFPQESQDRLAWWKLWFPGGRQRPKHRRPRGPRRR
jgi:hypothetical protein